MILEIQLKPLEPYFFGSDRTFTYSNSDNQKAQVKAESYYIRSEKLPSQTTLFGILRYIGIAKPDRNFHLTDEDINNIGRNSFDLLGTNQDYGKIHSISPLMLKDKQDNYLIRMPYDHRMDDKSKMYQPFKADDFQKVITSEGVKYLPVSYEVKNGFAEGFLNLTDGTYRSDNSVFQEVISIGIRRDLRKYQDTSTVAEKGFYKTLSYLMKEDSFVFFADVDDLFTYRKEAVIFAGKKKSAFALTIKENAKMPKLIKAIAVSPIQSKTKVITASSLYLSGIEQLEELYRSCVYVNTKTQDYRVVTTNYDEKAGHYCRFKKSELSLKLIQPGSIFLVQDLDTFLSLVKNQHARIAGFNHLIVGGEWYDITYL